MFAELDPHDFSDQPEAFTAELGRALTLLQATKDRQQDDPSTPKEIHTRDVEMVPHVFQVRGATPVLSHVVQLLVLLRQGRKLDPITLWRCGRHALLVDGHHRIEAYKLYSLEENKSVPVPCRWLDTTTTAVQAMEVAAETNTKVQLPMTAEQRSNLAWNMVKAGEDQFSKAQIARLSGRSTSQVAEMRRTLKQLGEDADKARSWAGALMKLRGLAPLTEEQYKERERHQVEKWVEDLGKTFGKQWYQRPGLVPDVLDGFLGTLSPRIAEQWVMDSAYIGYEKIEDWLKDPMHRHDDVDDPESDF